MAAKARGYVPLYRRLFGFCVVWLFVFLVVVAVLLLFLFLFLVVLLVALVMAVMLLPHLRIPPLGGGVGEVAR